MEGAPTHRAQERSEHPHDLGRTDEAGPSERALDKDLEEGHDRLMQVVTIREAKARLNALVEAALRGEQVVLMRGSEHVAAIVPVSSDDLELSPRLSDPQAERFWEQLAAERADEASLVFETPGEAIEHLSSPSPSSQRRPAKARGRARRTRSR
jgi:antitoxin (DNA-binding transcriptional repressor) of toxin-antitoxin stability system